MKEVWWPLKMNCTTFRLAHGKPGHLTDDRIVHVSNRRVLQVSN
jgi:hypothetical protein